MLIDVISSTNCFSHLAIIFVNIYVQYLIAIPPLLSSTLVSLQSKSIAIVNLKVEVGRRNHINQKWFLFFTVIF